MIRTIINAWHSLLRRPVDQGAPRLAVGTDLVFVPDVAQAIDQFGERYLNVVFTSTELKDCSSDLGQARLAKLGARVAAKEAVMKLLRPDKNTPLPWRSIEVAKHDIGFTSIALSGAAASLARQRGLGAIALSLSHERDYATAVAVAEVRLR